MVLDPAGAVKHGRDGTSPYQYTQSYGFAYGNAGDWKADMTSAYQGGKFKATTFGNIMYFKPRVLHSFLPGHGKTNLKQCSLMAWSRLDKPDEPTHFPWHAAGGPSPAGGCNPATGT